MKIISDFINKVLFRIPLHLFLRKAASGDNILLVRDDGIGDLVVSTSATVKWLCDNGYNVYVVVKKEFVQIAWLMLPQDRVISVDVKQYRTSITYRLNFLQKIRSIGFGWAIGSAIHSSVNNDIVRNSGARSRWAYQRKNTFEEKLKLLCLNKVPSAPEKDKDTVISYLRDGKKCEYTIYNSVIIHETNFLSGIFKIAKKSISINPYIDSSRIREVNGYGEYILYHVDAGSVKRVFPKERLLPLLSKISIKYGYNLVLTGVTPIECEEKCINLTGKTSLEEVITLIGNAQYVVGNESGLVHLSWIIGKHTAMFMGGGHFGRFRPSNATLLIKNPPCFCDNWKCIYVSDIFPCVNLTNDYVQKTLESFIEEPEACFFDWNKFKNLK